MQLFISGQYEQLEQNGKPTNQGQDHFPIVKLFLPGTGVACLLSEIRQYRNERFGYGLADYGYGSIHEGLIDLAALMDMTDPITHKHVRQDHAFIARHPLSIYLTAARMQGHITDSPDHLDAALRFRMPQEESPVITRPRVITAFKL